MNYSETIQSLYAATPLFTQHGGSAYKPGLQTTETLDAHFGHPHRSYATIHVAGTNGKGSCAHTLAALFQLLGFRTGLYTSPHLVDFRERIRVNGQPVSEQYVVDFVAQERPFFEPLHPSFFELTTAMAFKYFADARVDIAIVEVGLGGRLDCTNIITPQLSVITNISLDHTQFLGNTLAAIASEKAGIIKPAVPVVVGEALPETRPVFEERARQCHSPITFAEDTPEVLSSMTTSPTSRHYVTRHFGEFDGGLTGACQEKNTNTLLHAIEALRTSGLVAAESLTTDVVHRAFRDVCRLTGLRGRWEVVAERPQVICDTGHNAGGWQYIADSLRRFIAAGRKLHIVFGIMADKDVDGILTLLPAEATYYFTRADLPRALAEDELQTRAAHLGLQGTAYHRVAVAVAAAQEAATPADVVYVGGSGFVVAEALTYFSATLPQGS